MEPKIQWEKFHFQDDKEENDDDDDEGSDFEEPNRVIVPAFHLMSMAQKTDNPFTQLESFNFWIGHTNFKLTPELVKLIANANGIESLDIISPYRMVLSIAELFKPDRDVLTNIQGLINEAFKQPE